MSMTSIRNNLLLTIILCLLNGCWEFNSTPINSPKKQGEDDLPHVREVVGQNKIDLLRKYNNPEE